MFTNGLLYAFGTVQEPVTFRSVDEDVIFFDDLSNTAFPENLKTFGENIIIRDMEFVGGWRTLQIFSWNTTIDGNVIHGAGQDCVKLGTTAEPSGIRNKYFYLTGNTIYDCAEDGIDSMGFSNAYILNNDFSNYASNQIKGGSERIYFAGNHFHDAGSIISNGDRNITDSNVYGNPELSSYPVDERFSATYLTFSNNTAENITGWSGIKIGGCKNCTFYRNTLDGVNTWPIIVQSNWFEYEDDPLVAEYCATYPEDCKDCLNYPGTGTCTSVIHRPENVEIRRNDILSNGYMIRAEASALPWLDIEIGKNVYRTLGSQAIFNEFGAWRYSLESFTLDTTSSVVFE